MMEVKDAKLLTRAAELEEIARCYDPSLKYQVGTMVNVAGHMISYEPVFSRNMGNKVYMVFQPENSERPINLTLAYPPRQDEESRVLINHLELIVEHQDPISMIFSIHKIVPPGRTPHVFQANGKIYVRPELGRTKTGLLLVCGSTRQ